MSVAKQLTCVALLLCCTTAFSLRPVFEQGKGHHRPRQGEVTLWSKTRVRWALVDVYRLRNASCSMSLQLEPCSILQNSEPVTRALWMAGVSHRREVMTFRVTQYAPDVFTLVDHTTISAA